ALAAKGVANDERGFLLSGGRATYREEADRRIAEAQAAFGGAAGAAATDEQRRAAIAAEAGFERWVATVREVFAGYASARQAATAKAVGRDRAVRKRYEAMLARAQSLGAQAIR